MSRDNDWAVDLWSHPKMTDVALEIISKGPVVNGRQELKVRWWNRGKCHAPWDMNIPQVIHPTVEWVESLEYYVRASLI